MTGSTGGGRRGWLIAFSCFCGCGMIGSTGVAGAGG